MVPQRVLRAILIIRKKGFGQDQVSLRRNRVDVHRGIVELARERIKYRPLAAKQGPCRLLLNQARPKPNGFVEIPARGRVVGYFLINIGILEVVIGRGQHVLRKVECRIEQPASASTQVNCS